MALRNETAALFISYENRRKLAAAMNDTNPFEKRPPVTVYRRPGRPGIEPAMVYVAADQLLHAGERPTVDRVRQVTGGSPNTIAPLLDEWWKGLAGRLKAPPSVGAFERLPGELPLIAEAFFQECVKQARSRVKAEIAQEHDQLTRQRMEQDVKGHFLTLREKELSELARRYQTRTEELERELREQATYVRKVQISKDHLERKVSDLEQQLHALQLSLKLKAKAQKKIPIRKKAKRSKSRVTTKSNKGRVRRRR